MKTEEIASKTVYQKSEMDRIMQSLGEENTDLQKQISSVQAQLAEAEQQHAQRWV